MISGKNGAPKNSGVPGNLENHDIWEKRHIPKIWLHIQNHINPHIRSHIHAHIRSRIHAHITSHMNAQSFLKNEEREKRDLWQIRRYLEILKKRDIQKIRGYRGGPDIRKNHVIRQEWDM